MSPQESPEAVSLDEGPSDAKALGAYWTDTQAADFLAWWAIRSAGDTVLEPCFGGGVFLRSACRQLHRLGGNPEEQVCGVEIDAEVHRSISEKLADEFLLR